MNPPANFQGIEVRDSTFGAAGCICAKSTVSPLPLGPIAPLNGRYRRLRYTAALGRNRSDCLQSHVDPVLPPRSILAYDDVAAEVAHDLADKYTPTHNPAPTTYSSQVAGMAYG